MREGKPSRTAQFVALNRALGTLAPRVPGFADPLAKQFLSDKWRRKVERTGAALAAGNRQSPYPLWQRAMGIFNQFRTVILDRAIAATPTIEQLVILGAGLDSRAWRLESLKNTTVYEVDFPASQAWKRERALSVPFLAKDVRFVEIDFQREALTPRLRAAGFDPSRATFWLWEGVTMYLTSEVVSANFAEFAALSAPGSRIALTYLRKKNGRIPRNLFLALLGEPVRSAFEPQEITALAQSHGWKRIQDSNVENWMKETPGLKMTRRQVGLHWLESIWVGERA
ncbi:MAG TPA: SAM-dependent methyltransferase [Bryobacteraceae bacterium]|nr:SAM-dependent methyltransferase [Bryobacteraceae bacterium]